MKKLFLLCLTMILVLSGCQKVPDATLPNDTVPPDSTNTQAQEPQKSPLLLMSELNAITDENLLDSPDYRYIEKFSAGWSGSALMSLTSNEMLYLMGADNRMNLHFDVLDDPFIEGENIKIYVRGAILNTYFTHMYDSALWYLTSIEYGGKVYKLEEDLRMVGNQIFYVFTSNEGFAVMQYTSGGNLYIISDERLMHFNRNEVDGPDFDGFGASYYFYSDEAGQLCYSATAVPIAAESNQHAYWHIGFVTSPDVLSRIEGYVEIGEEGFILHPEREYTIEDYFILIGTTAEEWFDTLGDAAMGCKNLDELYEYNKNYNK